MILALVAAALPGLFWSQGPETAATLRDAGIQQIYVAPERVDDWRGQPGIEARAVDLEAATKLPTPGVDFRINRASATRAPWITANGWEFLRAPSSLFYYEAPGSDAELAQVEAFAYGARAMIQTDEAGLEAFRRMREFLRTLEQPNLPEYVDIGVVDDGSFESAEMMTMLTRGNLLFKIVEKPDPSLKLNVQLGTPGYAMEEATEPHVLAAKIRRQLTDAERSLRIYGNSVVIAHLEGDATRMRVHLLNYAGAERPVHGIRVRVLGRYSRQKVAAAGVQDAQLMDERVFEDATEFTIPEMKVYAVVDLFP